MSCCCCCFAFQIFFVIVTNGILSGSAHKERYVSRFICVFLRIFLYKLFYTYAYISFHSTICVKRDVCTHHFIARGEYERRGEWWRKKTETKSEIEKTDRIKSVWNKVKEKRNTTTTKKNINNSFTVNWCSFYFWVYIVVSDACALTTVAALPRHHSSHLVFRFSILIWP